MEVTAALCQRLDGSTMANHSPLSAASASSWSATHLPAAGHQRHPLCREDRLPMADAALQFPQLEHGLRHLLAMAKRGRSGRTFTTPCERKHDDEPGRNRRLPWPSSTANRCVPPKAASNEGTMPARRFPVGSGIWPWIRWG